MSEEKQKNIYQRMCDIQRDIGHIGKDEENKFHHFNFRGIDTVYNELHGLLAKHGVFSMPEVLVDTEQDRKSSKGGNLIYRVLKIKYTFYSEDGSFLSAIVIGEGMDSGDKAANKAMAVAHKYALLQVFTVPTAEQKDPDAESHEVMPREPVSGAITDAQGRMIWAISSKLWTKNTKEEIQTVARELDLPESSREMSKAQASKLIERLQKLKEISEGIDPDGY